MTGMAGKLERLEKQEQIECPECSLRQYIGEHRPLHQLPMKVTVTKHQKNKFGGFILSLRHQNTGARWFVELIDWCIMKESEIFASQCPRYDIHN
jgi:hypothetical protein